jgi:uncharacterized protein YdeI (YjbR/CyaY-like superfamily)
MKPIFFAAQSDFRRWLEENYDRETELFVGFYKVGSGKASMNWSESVNEALCFGWIDGVRRTIDAESYCIRFTPRKPTSIWSAVNIKKVAELTAKGLMQPAGIAAFEKREAKKSAIYAYEKEALSFSDEFEERFKSNDAAWQFFCSQAPSYRKTIIHWVMSAKQDATRNTRLEKLIATSAAGRRV